MGNINSLESQSQNNKQRKGFLQKVQKVSSDYSQKWGNYSIYQQQQKPYDYFLEYIHVSLAQRDFLEKKLAYYQNMPKHKNLVPVEYAQIVKRKQMCAQFDVLRVFCMYYNFTLEDGIKVKIKQRANFSQGQLVYILRSLLLIGSYYENELKAKCYSGIFQCRDIFISPQGHLKIYPFNENIFNSFLEMYGKKEKNLQMKKQEKMDVLIKVNEGKKQGLGLDRNGMRKTEQRKGGLRTTLRDQSLKEVNSVKQFNGLRDKQLQQSQSYFMRHQSQLNYTNRQSEDKESINEKIREQQYLSSRKSSNGQDWFQLGLLMMQLVLLNQSHQYYLQKRSMMLESSNINNLGFNKDKLISSRQNSKVYDQSKAKNYHNLGSTLSYQNNSFISNNKQYSYHQEYLNHQGKLPNFDLIYFSLHNLLPKKNISPTLIQIISLLLSHQYQNLTYQQLINIIQQHQESLTQPKYCLKFDVSKNQDSFTPQSSDKQFSRYMVKNQSLDPLLKTTNLSSNAFINNDSSFNSIIYDNKLLSQSKQSFFARNLDDLVNANNLTKSMVVEGQDNNNSTLVLDNLKKSRKLVPTKIRSISNKNTDLPEMKNKKESQNFQFNFN